MRGYDQGLILARTIGEPGYRFVSVSRAGYLSTPPTAGQTPAEQADLCADLLDTLGIGETALMAVSGGGPCALQFALRHRDRCWGLVLVSTCSGKVDTRLPLSFQLMKLLARWPAFVAMMRREWRETWGGPLALLSSTRSCGRARCGIRTRGRSSRRCW